MTTTTAPRESVRCLRHEINWLQRTMPSWESYRVSTFFSHSKHFLMMIQRMMAAPCRHCFRLSCKKEMCRPCSARGIFSGLLCDSRGKRHDHEGERERCLALSKNAFPSTTFNLVSISEGNSFSIISFEKYCLCWGISCHLKNIILSQHQSKKDERQMVRWNYSNKDNRRK